LAHVYVYYRIPAADAAVALRQAEALQALLAPYCASAPRLMRGCDDAATWMEVYEGVADLEAFAAAMARCLNAPGVEALRCSERHLECFREV
jgi:hypothetical protein